MIKIPTLFVRDPAKQFRVIPQLTLGCDWVLEGLGFPTVKIDGQTIKVLNGEIYRKLRPADGTHEAAYVKVLEGDQEYPYLKEAFEACRARAATQHVPDGIYEAFGPKIAGNHHGCETHNMIRIAPVSSLLLSNIADGAGIVRGPGVTVERLFDSIQKALEDSPDIEGIVWHREERATLIAAAKIKRKDFGLPWPAPMVKDPPAAGIILAGVV